jgi:hypothetical protein
LPPSSFHDEFEPIEFTEAAGRQLDAIRLSDSALFGRILRDIQLHLIAWSPGDEDRVVIKHVRKLSEKCQRKIYRLKSPPTIQKWRVFFTYLDARRPAVRLVLSVIEYVSEEQCYDDMSQPHAVQIRRDVLAASTRGDFRRKRG